MSTVKTLTSIFAAILSLAGVGSAGAAETKIKPPVNLDKPVTNPRLVVAIHNHQRHQTNESAVELFSELKRSNFLVAIVLEKAPEQTGEGQARFKKGDIIKVVQLRDANDKSLLALFTDHEQLQKWTHDANSTLVMPTKQAFNFVIEKGYDGLVINPADGASLRLEATFIQKALKDI